MKKHIFSAVTAGVLAVFCGCGGNGNTSTPTTITGAAVDDYVIDGNVSIYNLNGKLLGRCTTSSYGEYTCKITNVDKNEKLIIIINGGKLDKDGNISTTSDEIKFTGTLAAVTTPEKSVIINPKTTKLIADAIGSDNNMIYDQTNKRAFIIGKIDPKKIAENVNIIFNKEQELLPDSFVNSQEDVKTQAQTIKEQLQNNFQEIRQISIRSGNYGTNFLIHMADIHLTSNSEVENVFDGKIPPISEVNKTVREIISYSPDEIIQTGDIVALADRYGLDQDEEWFKLAKEYIVDPIIKADIPFLYAPGNHDPAGITVKDINISDPRYGNGLLLKYIDTYTSKNTDDYIQGKTYYSYDKGNYHFIVLDPKETPDSNYRAVELPDEELEWLKNDLQNNTDNKFIIISYHQPLGSWVKDSYNKFIQTLSPYKDRVILLVGHTHDNRIVYRDGIPEYQDGAVCGDWWDSGKTPDGNPDGYAIYYIQNGIVNRFYKGEDVNKQANLLSPVNIDLNQSSAVKFNVYDANKTITSAQYAIDGKIEGNLSVNSITIPGKITWYGISGVLTPVCIDNKEHNVTFIFKTADGNDFNSIFLYKFSNNRFLNISEILNDANFNSFYGRFVEVNATIVDADSAGNHLVLKDKTGKIDAWTGDTYHPEFKTGDMVYFRGQVTAFKGTKELKLVNYNDVKIYGETNITIPSYELSSIQDAYDNFSKYENSYVTVDGIVTANFGKMKIIQDNTRGIALYSGNMPDYGLGSRIKIKGKLVNYYGVYEIEPDNNKDIELEDSNVTLPNPQIISTNEILNNINNFVELDNVKVTSIDTSSITVSDDYNTTTIYCGKAGFDPSKTVKTGDIVNIKGIASVYNGKSEIYPRNTDDITVIQTSESNESNNTASNTNIKTISNIYTNFDSLNGQYIETAGVVTANFGSNIAIQDDTHGIMLYVTSSIPKINIGNEIKVKGEVTSYKGLVELKISNSNITVEGNTTVPEPKSIMISELEKNMGTLVKLSNVEVTNVTSTSITVKDGDGNTAAIYCGKAKFDPSELVNTGDIIDVTGISAMYNTPQILPRNEKDIVKK